MSIQKLPNVSSIDEIVAVLRDDGVVCIHNFATPETMGGLRQDLLPLLEGTRSGDDPFFHGEKTRRLSRLFARTDHAEDVVMNPLFLETARKILQDKPVRIWMGNQQIELTPDIQISATQAIQILPGQPAQPLHRDDGVHLWRHPTFGREARVNFMLAVSDFTEENGATRVIPRSHKWDDERMPKVEETIAAEMGAGDALIWLGSTYHGGGENRSNGARTGVTMVYDLSYLRQEENQYISLPIEKVKTFPEELQRLLGWARGETYVGFVEVDGQVVAPLELLARNDFTDVGLIP